MIWLDEMKGQAERQKFSRRLRQAYDRTAEERSRGEMEPWKAAERQRFLDELIRSGSRRLLEVGAGHGRDSLFFRDHGLAVTSADLSFNMAALCRRNGLKAVQADMRYLPFTPESFDAVFAMNSLLHLPRKDIHAVLRQIHSLLNAGGWFYYGVYGGKNHEGIWGEDSYRPKRFFNYYLDEDLIALVSVYFEVVTFRRIEIHDRGGLHFQSMILRKA